MMCWKKGDTEIDVIAKLKAAQAELQLKLAMSTPRTSSI